MSQPVSEVFHDSIHDHNPAGIMRAMIKMKRAGGNAAYDLAALEVARRTWELASLALVGEPRHSLSACEEREKFKFWIHELKEGIMHRKEAGVMLLQAEDWPSLELMLKAEGALEFAQMTSID